MIRIHIQERGGNGVFFLFCSLLSKLVWIILVRMLLLRQNNTTFLLDFPSSSTIAFVLVQQPCRIGNHQSEKSKNVLLVAPNSVSITGIDTNKKEENDNGNDNGNGNSNGTDWYQFHNKESIFDRRFFVRVISTTTTIPFILGPFSSSSVEASTKAVTITEEKKKVVAANTFGVSDRVVESLVYEKILGRGSYKIIFWSTLCSL